MSWWALLSVLGLLGLFAGLALVLRRYAGPTLVGGQAVHILGYRRLDPANGVWLVEVDGRRLLIGGGGRGGVRLLADLTTEATPLAPRRD